LAAGGNREQFREPGSQRSKPGEAELEDSSCQFEVLQPPDRQLAGQQIVHLQAGGGNAAKAQLLYSLFPAVRQASHFGRDNINVKSVLSRKRRISAQLALE
jgi:hypothetical protein